jgi:hypothetical protein
LFFVLLHRGYQTSETIVELGHGRKLLVASGFVGARVFLAFFAFVFGIRIFKYLITYHLNPCNFGAGLYWKFANEAREPEYILCTKKGEGIKRPNLI